MKKNQGIGLLYFGAEVESRGCNHQDGRKLGITWYQNVYVSNLINTWANKIILWVDRDC